jgi:membrane protein YqaA with SNARE-associated domain
MPDLQNSSDFSDLLGIKEIPAKPVPPWVKTAIFLFEIVFVLGLLIWWLSSAPIRQSKSLWVLFFYCFPAEFIIATVPHEPVLFYFAKFYPPLTIALVSIAGTVLTEIINYNAFRYVADWRVLQKMLRSQAVRKTVALFKKAPFIALWVAAFTPIPFYPFRFLVVLAKYPLIKYLLAVVTSRTPRFFILALAARAIKVPDYLLLILFVVLIAVANIPILRKVRRGRQKPADSPPPAP